MFGAEVLDPALHNVSPSRPARSKRPPRAPQAAVPRPARAPRAELELEPRESQDRFGPAPPTAPARGGDWRQSGSVVTATRLLHHWIIILACVILVPFAALLYSVTQTEQYTASAALLFKDPNFDDQVLDRTNGGSVDLTRQAATNAQLVRLDVVAERTARRLRGARSAQQVANAIEVEARADSDVISLSATDPDPALAARIANFYGEEYKAFRRDADRDQLLRAQQLLQTQIDRLSAEERASDRGRELATQAAQLSTIAALQTGNVDLVERATVPTGPSSPKVKRNLALGLFGGLALGLGIAALLELFGGRLRESDDVEATLEAPVLARIPEDREPDEPDVVADPALQESFHTLRSSLRYLAVDRSISSVMVTSADVGEGKTAVAWGLATAAAESGARTLFIEADLRRPTVALRAPQAEASGGLGAVLIREATLDEAVVEVSLFVRAQVAFTLDVLPAGSPPPNPVRLLESDEMRSVLRDVTREYDFVVIDTPPVTIVADAVPLIAQVDGVLVVARHGKTSRKALGELRSQLANVRAPVLGAVLNAVPDTIRASHYH